MKLRDFLIGGETISAPAYIHRTADGWRISQAGFSRSWEDSAHGGPKGALIQATALLRLILEQDEATLRALFNGKVDFYLDDRSGVVCARATITDSTKTSKIIELRRFNAGIDAWDGKKIDINDPAAIGLIGRHNHQMVYEAWSTELRRCFKNGWVKDILAHINHHYPASKATPQLSLI